MQGKKNNPSENAVKQFEIIDEINVLIQDEETVIKKAINSGPLTDDQINEIRKGFEDLSESKKESFYEIIGEKKQDHISYERLIIKHLLYPATMVRDWIDLPIPQQKAKKIRIILEAASLTGTLNWITIHISDKLINNDALTVYKYIQSWGLFFNLLKKNLWQHHTYNLQENPYYGIIEIWFNDLKETYSLENLKTISQIGNNSHKIRKNKADLRLIPKDKPGNKEILISALKAGRIIDSVGKIIPTPRGRTQYLNGIIDALKEYKIIIDHPHTTLHKLICEEILHIPYQRVSVEKFKNDSAYNIGKAETTSYLASISAINVS